VSAAKALAEKTNADLYQSFYEDYSKVDTEAKGATAKYNLVRDGDLFKIGSLKIKAIHTPGHTAGSISLLVEQDNDGDNNNSSNETDNLELHRSLLLLFTGDVLFVNGIGRPDLRDRVQEF
jgi:glyoxylase-like metal-dependent hydrolase (beta-lactamase superfamily II)